MHTVAQVSTKLSAPASATPGSDITYGLELSNQGPGQAEDLSVTLFLPVGVDLVSASGMPSSKSSVAVQWQPLNIATGHSVTYNVVAKVAAPTKK